MADRVCDQQAVLNVEQKRKVKRFAFEMERLTKALEGWRDNCPSCRAAFAVDDLHSTGKCQMTRPQDLRALGKNKALVRKHLRIQRFKWYSGCNKCRVPQAICNT